MNRKEKENVSAYNRIAGRFLSYREKKETDPLVTEFASYLKKGDAVLDIGCTSGCPIDLYLSKKGLSVQGIDPSEEMIGRALRNKIPNASFLCTDFASYQDKRKYRGVIAFDSLFFYTSYKKIESCYRKISSLLEEGGILLFTAGKIEGENEGTMYGEQFHYASCSVMRTLELLKEKGFSVLKSETDYKDSVSGSRDLVVMARKVSPSSISLKKRIF